MTDIDTLCESTKLRLIACALGLQQCTKTAANLIPIPGTNNLIMVGPADWIAKNVPGVEANSKQQAALTPTDYVRLWCAHDLPAAANWAYSDQVFEFARAIESTAVARLAATTQASTAQAEPVSSRPLNGIQATHRHDEGAIACCAYCGRYSIDPATLSDRQPTCECGKQHGWSGSFRRPGPDAKWSGKAPVAQEAATNSTDAQAAAEVRTDAARDVLAERRRQIEAEGWTPEHDDAHNDGQMAGAAACYAVADITHWARDEIIGTLWPWSAEWWKPSSKRRNLIKAGALILAEIECIDRAAIRSAGDTGGVK